MNATDSKIPATFEQYLAEHNIAADDPHVENWRRFYDQERLSRDSEPSVTPPCPSWCRKDEGHPYDSTEWDFVTHLRTHASVHDDISSGARVEAMERNKGGEVEVLAPVIGVYVEEELTSEDARRYGAELLAAAELLDEIAQ